MEDSYVRLQIESLLIQLSQLNKKYQEAVLTNASLKIKRTIRIKITLLELDLQRLAENNRLIPWIKWIGVFAGMIFYLIIESRFNGNALCETGKRYI